MDEDKSLSRHHCKISDGITGLTFQMLLTFLGGRNWRMDPLTSEMSSVDMADFAVCALPLCVQNVYCAYGSIQYVMRLLQCNAYTLLPLIAFGQLLNRT
jgi:hypothetical protein